MISSLRVVDADRKMLEIVLDLYYSFYVELRSKQGLNPGSKEKYRSDVEEMFSRGDKIFIAFINDRPVGFVRISEREGAYWIEEIFVLPNYRGHGIGRALLEKAEEFISKRDIAAYVMVLPQDKDAINFWLKMGYRVLNTIELVKEFVSTDRSKKVWLFEIFGYPVLLPRWEKEKLSDIEREYLIILEKFLSKFSREDYLRIITEALKEVLSKES
ncbi:MAG: GNAT family N-acetyltransferase [Candidatus Njordarchaeales archaeon]